MKTLDDLAVTGRRVLVRADLNVPLDEGRITDDGRIKATLPTLTALMDRGAEIVVCSHLGRPGGQPDLRYSLAPVAARLAYLLNQEVEFPGDIVGPAAHAAVAALRPGGLVMLENLRFNDAETSTEEMVRGYFADRLVAMVDTYVADGFGAMHRKHASVYDVPLRLPSAAGYLVQAEVAALRQLTGSTRRPYVVVLGGAKVTDKFGAIGTLIARADQILLGGAMAFPFLAAQGHKVGTSVLDPVQVELATSYLHQAARAGTEIVLPTDVIVAADRTAGQPHQLVTADSMPADLMGLDIGPDTAASFADRILRAGTVFWNGPMGVFESPAYADGTRTIAQALTDSQAFNVVGGGDTGAAIRGLGFPDSAFGYVSTGGGASLEFIQGKALPGLTALAEP
ncbi:MAG: phosphoglycerate kinase [Streptosporangiaceae bacterium]